ncbi:type VI secretion system tip protein TssI/VgrG, partial [Escherichia coli]|uniref:type VI secretion system tip protein TssI/VgrG n=4 Tax=Escherichia coli TaxID=562 RepID=UPI002FEFE4ED
FSEPHPSREFCVQYGETDYDFLCRMAAEEGIFFYEDHAYKSTDQSLVLCDTVRHLPESFEIPWNPNTRTEVSTLCISQFRYSAQIRPSSVVTKDYTFKRPGWAGRFDQEGQHQDYQRTQYEVYDYPGRFKGAHGQNFARWQMDGWRNNAETARGMSRSPEIWPGRRIVLTGHPQANLNREWQVVASELHGEQPQAVPGRQGAGTALENHFAVIPADRTWRPQPLLKPLVDGPQSAVVTGPAGEEIFCDEHGRVRVKFNWDRYNPADQDSSCWIRVAQAWAGTGFGHLAIPRVGQEVIVDFLNGDPDQPIIMGRTYHHENRTPGSLPGTKTQMTIRSKTYKGSGFNELKFDDATGKEQVYIHAQKNMNTEVLNNRTTDVINNHAETIGNNQMIAVTNNQIQTVGVNQIETVGSNPVNPLLGAKVLPGETDLALPGPLPFILSRTYSSYRTKTPAPVGVFGPGWKAPSDIRLQIRDDALVLNDNGGRSIHFEPLLPGEAVYSRSESMWLVRGGKAVQPDGHTLARLWASLPPDIRLSPHLYLATNSAQGPWWILGWSEGVPGAEDVLPAPLPPYRVLTGMADRFGRTLAYRCEAAGDLAGEITGVTDGAGREFRLVLTTQAQRAEEARKPHTASLSSPDSPRPLSAPSFPDTLPGTEYGADSGIRLSAVWLMHDPEYPENLPAAPLVCYDWTPRGELAAVY